jgi:hypothetical protein
LWEIDKKPVPAGRSVAHQLHVVTRGERDGRLRAGRRRRVGRHGQLGGRVLEELLIPNDFMLPRIQPMAREARGDLRPRLFSLVTWLPVFDNRYCGTGNQNGHIRATTHASTYVLNC